MRRHVLHHLDGHYPEERGHQTAHDHQQRTNHVSGAQIFTPGRHRHGGGDGDGGDNSAHVRFKNVGTHAGNITHIVAHVVGNNTGISGVVLRNAGFNLAH